MELVLIKQGSSEWEYMWNWLSSHPINEKIAEPSIALNKGESWQYMGSFKQDDKVIHEFRHRLHPRTNTTQTLSLNASDNMNGEDIQVERKLHI